MLLKCEKILGWCFGKYNAYISLNFGQIFSAQKVSAIKLVKISKPNSQNQVKLVFLENVLQLIFPIFQAHLSKSSFLIVV